MSAESRIKFDLYLKFSQHLEYFGQTISGSGEWLKDLTVHIIPSEKKDPVFLYLLRGMMAPRMTKKSRKSYSGLCIGLNSEVVLDSILQNNFILFLKIDGVVEGFASGNIRDNPRKPMIYIDILCSNPIKYQGIGKKLMDFFKYTILLTYLKDLENENVDAPIRYALRLNSVNNSNTMKFYEKNGMKCLEHEIKYKPSKDDILYPYIWKLDFLLDKEDHPAIIERMLEYKINDGIKWTNSNEYSGRQTLVERDELSVPSVMTHSRGGTRKKLPLKNKFKH